nr:hypothetical protein [uncultured Anaerostipes sp.]
MKQHVTRRVRIKEALNKILHRNRDKKKNYLEYKDLAPTSNIENGEEYIEALNWALDNPRIKNIALAGPYGAGKSSIIETYLKNGKLKKIKNISDISLKIAMASFTQDEKASDGKISLEEEEIEEGILKQLFYRVQHKKIPQSRYRKLHVKNFKGIFVTTGISIIILSIICTIFFPQLSSFVWRKIVNFIEVYHLPEKCSVLLLLFLWVFASFIVSRLSCLLSNRYYLKEITLPVDAKIEAESSLSDSVFNKNLDEIMYFFEATKFRIVFFEDLDRLNDRKIFIHLRELNNLLNNDESIKEKPIVFVYAVRDNIFIQDDRTKFFDFIIPVIPVINSTNSGEILLERLEDSRKNGIDYDISQAFVLDVSPYISDMRILKNIYNEFVLYQKTVKRAQKLKLSDEQMMAIIIFKNLYPSDFADIEEEKGIIKEAFENKRSYIKKQKEQLQIQINDYEQVIEKAKLDSLRSVRELKAAMLVEITDGKGYMTGLGDKWYVRITASTIMEDSFDMYGLLRENYSVVYYNTFSGHNDNKEINKEKIKSYLERWENLNKYEKEGEKNLLDQLEDLKKMQHDLSGKSIASVISECNDFFFDPKIANNKLLVFLLRRGYLDEKYGTYINYFKGNSITTEDMNFILSVKNREPKDFTYNLTKKARVIQRLQEYEFEEKAVYNFDLMEQLLSNDDEKEKRNIFIRQLSDGSDISWSFIDEFVDKTKYQEKFIILMSSAWHGIWKYILKLPTIQYERQLYYLSLFINILNADAIDKINIDNSIKQYMESHADILQRLSITTSKQALCSILKILNISFGIQDINGVPDALIEYIFDNFHYKLNEKMISNIVVYKNSKMIENLKNQPYTTIVDLGYSELLQYTNSNFDYYIENNVLNKSSLEDRVDVIKEMLSKILSNREKCVALIELEQFCLDDITLFFEEKIEDYKEDIQVIWDALLRNCKVAPIWKNIMTYWKYFFISQELVDYMRSQISKLKLASTYCCTDEFIKDFISADLKSDMYEQLLPVLRMKDFDFELETLDRNILSVMIDIKYFDFTTSRYNYLFEVYPDLAIKYIIKNQEEFFEQEVEQIKMSSQLLNDLLTNQSIDNSVKVRLVDLFAENNMSEDIIDYIITKKIRITKACFEVAWTYANINQKGKMFRRNLELLNCDDLEKYFADLDGEYTEFANRGSRHVVVLGESTENIRLAKYLEKVQYITSYRIEESNKFDKVSKTYEKQKVIKYRIKQKK